jgi:hypothetical protein
MSVRTVADKFMELCSQGKHFDFMRAYYAPEMVSVEGNGQEFAGKEEVIHNPRCSRATTISRAKTSAAPSS